MFWPCETRTSTCRNFATISSGLYRFLAITVLLDVKDIPQVGPLQWGRITSRLERDRAATRDVEQADDIAVLNDRLPAQEVLHALQERTDAARSVIGDRIVALLPTCLASGSSLCTAAAP